MGVTWRHLTQAPTLCCEFSSMSFLLSRSKRANTSVCARSSSAGHRPEFVLPGEDTAGCLCVPATLLRA